MFRVDYRGADTISQYQPRRRMDREMLRSSTIDLLTQMVLTRKENW